MKHTFVLVLALSLGLAAFAVAQTEKGNIYGTVTDESGGVLPGATATLSGAFGAQTTVTDEAGKFRFLNIDHGNYTVTVELSGFNPMVREVVLAAGTNLDLGFPLGLTGVEETVTVTADTPVVDIRKMGTEQTVQADELEKIPTSRDPWALLRTVAGVQLDRVNVAGSESGQQSGYQGAGSHNANNTWNIDGIPITDMSAVGASPGYYTYDTFDEINITTGAADITSATGGVHMNMVTKRGSNNLNASFNFNWADDSLQSSNLPPSLEGDERLQGNDKADHIDNITEYSVDVGGPIWKDHLWGYFSYGKNQIDIIRLTQSPDQTTLKNTVGKINWQATDKDSVSYFFFLPAKEKIGRPTGVEGLIDTDRHLRDQGNAFPNQPHGFNKAEWNRVWTPNMITNVKFARFNTGFTLGTRTADVDEIVDFVRSEVDGGAEDRRFLRPQTTLRVDGSYFANLWGGSHEIKYGVGWKKAEADSIGLMSGNKVQSRINPAPDISQARFYRDRLSGVEASYTHFYIGDIFTKDRWTLSLSGRFDRQIGTNKPAEIPGNPLIPELLPGLSFAGGGTGINWTNFSPRIGMTYALDEEYKTVLRGSFNRYQGQLPTGLTAQDNPLGARAYLQYNWYDNNGDRFVQVGEVDFDAGVTAFAGLDPNDPAAIDEPVDQIDPNFKADIDYETIIGVDHELRTDFAVGAAFTWRRSTDYRWGRGLNFLPDIGVIRDDYHQGEAVTTGQYTSVPWIVNDGVLDRPEVTGGTLLTNRDNYSRSFRGLQFTLNKRLSNRWMTRAALSFNSWKENIGDYVPNGNYANPSYLDDEPMMNGGQAIRQTGGSGRTYYMTSGWQFNVSGLYQLPADVDISGNLFGRQGYPQPIYHRIDLGVFEGRERVLAVNDVNQVRLSNMFLLDFRVAKNFNFDGGHAITLAAEIFNALNASTTNAQVVDISSPSFGRIDEILSPRVVRLVFKVRY